VMYLAFSILFAVAAVASASNKEGLVFLEENAMDDMVTETPSGLQYQVIADGDPAGESPELDTPVVCHYTGSLLSGEVFDSSLSRGAPATFAPSGVIKGWTEALQMMRPGDKWKLWIPSELAYGDSGSGSMIKGGDVLVFELEVLEVKTGEVAPSGIWAAMEKPALFGIIPGFKTWHLFALMLIFKVMPLISGSGGGTKVTASHILVDTEEECAKIKGEIEKGSGDVKTLFSEQASKSSKCSSGKQGGSLGEFGPGSMVAEFDAVCFDESKAIGEVHGPIKTQFGHHLILVEERKAPPTEKKGQ